MATAKEPKQYTIEMKSVGRAGDRPPRLVEGTLPELIKYFGYTLEIGHSWNNKIKTNPTTIKSLMSNLEKSYEEKEGSTYNRTLLKLIDKEATNG